LSTLISIVIPTYKRPHLLTRALASICQSKLAAIDVLVVDDDVEMSAADIVRNFPDVRYVAKRGVSQGLSKSRNIGIELAEGRYILFLDDDDFLLPGAIDVFAENLNSKFSFYYSDFRYLRKNGEEPVSLDSVAMRKLLVVNEIPVGAYLIEKSAVKVPFDTCMNSHEDWQFLLSNVDWSLAKYLGVPVVGIDKTSDDDSSMQNRRREQFWMDFLTIYAKFPAPEHAELRSQMLLGLGVNIPKELLGFAKKC
jgi:GalNAc5-diNAcBac-PP-undecaprenol beta-1,3-glucosyltransferase